MLQSTWTNGCKGATKLSHSIVTESPPSSWSRPCGRWCSLPCSADMKRFTDKITGRSPEQRFQVFGELEKGSPFTTPLIYHQHPTWSKSVTQIWARLPQLPWTLPIRISSQVILTAFTAQLLSMFTTTYSICLSKFSLEWAETKQSCVQGSRTSMDHILSWLPLRMWRLILMCCSKLKTTGRSQTINATPCKVLDTQWFCDTPLRVTEELGLSVLSTEFSNNLRCFMVNSDVVFEPFCTLLKQRKQSEVDGWRDGVDPPLLYHLLLYPPLSSHFLSSPPISSSILSSFLKWSVSNCPFGCLSWLNCISFINHNPRFIPAAICLINMGRKHWELLVLCACF